MPLHSSITLIVTNVNGSESLRANLSSVMEAVDAYRGEGRVIVVDESVTEHGLETLMSDFPEIDRVVHHKEHGFFSAICAEVQAVSDDVVIFLSADVQPDADFIAPLVARLNRPEVFAVQSAIRVDRPEVHPSCLSRYGFHLGALKRLPTPELGREGWMCLYASGICMAVNREKFLALGGFLSLLTPFGWEDFDLGVRAWRRGWETWLEPRSVVLHLEKGSIRDRLKKRTIRWAQQRNQLLAEWIHYPLPVLLLTSPLRILMRLMFRLVTGNFGYLSALASALSKFPDVIPIRREIKESASLSLNAVLRIIADENAGHTELDRNHKGGCCGV